MRLRKSRRTYLSGLMWDIYLYIITSREPVGVREIWRALALSSPSLAQYHINNLQEQNLVIQTPDGRYIADEKARVEALRNFVFLGGRLISRMAFYGSFIFGLFLIYLIFWPIEMVFRDILFITICIFSVSAFFLEAYNQHRGLKKSIHRIKC